MEHRASWDNDAHQDSSSGDNAPSSTFAQRGYQLIGRTKLPGVGARPRGSEVCVERGPLRIVQVATFVVDEQVERGVLGQARWFIDDDSATRRLLTRMTGSSL